MKRIVVNEEMPQIMTDKLKSLFSYDIYKCKKFNLFENPIAAHPDMNYLQVKNNLFTIYDILNSSENYCSKSEKLRYPQDVLLNAFCVGEDFICKTNAVYNKALAYAKSVGMNVIGVNQGYVKCNLALVNESEKAIITEDCGIYKTLKEHGYDVLLLEINCVKLDPYKYGFIGGATGNIDGKLVFTGNLLKPPEHKRIMEFCCKHKTECISLAYDELYDYGSILLLDI